MEEERRQKSRGTIVFPPADNLYPVLESTIHGTENINKKTQQLQQKKSIS